MCVRVTCSLVHNNDIGIECNDQHWGANRTISGHRPGQTDGQGRRLDLPVDQRPDTE